MAKIPNTIEIIQELYRIYGRLNRDWWHGELPDVCITLNPGKSKGKSVYGTFSPKAWKYTDITHDEKAENVSGAFQAKEERIFTYRHEISISPEYFLRPIANWVTTIQHEVCHLFDEINDIPDTSNNSVYHNARFKATAEEHGLVVEKAPTVGWAITTPSPEFEAWCDTLDIDEELFAFFRDTFVKESDKTTPKKRYVCPKCGKEVQGKKDLNIVCGDCMLRMDWWEMNGPDGEPSCLEDYNDGYAMEQGWWHWTYGGGDTVAPPSGHTPDPDPDTDDQDGEW